MSNDFWRGYLVASIISILSILFVGSIAHCNEQITNIIRKEALSQGFDPEIAIAIATIESSLNPNAIGPKKEVGLFQILPRFSPVPRIALFDPSVNARVGIEKLIEAQKKCRVHNKLTYVICFNNGISRKPKYPLLHPYYKRFIIAWRNL